MNNNVEEAESESRITQIKKYIIISIAWDIQYLQFYMKKPTPNQIRSTHTHFQANCSSNVE